MGAVNKFTYAFWVMNVGVQLGLLCVLIVRRELARYPAFAAYLAVNLLQSAAFVFVFPLFPKPSKAPWIVGWISQGTVVVARSFAVAEVCRGILASYRGIWAMGWRMLVAVGCIVLGFALAFGRHDLKMGILTLDLGTELAIAAVMVFLFVFARYYEVPLDNPMRVMGIAFCLFSCASVVNNVFLQRFLTGYANVWNLTGTSTFLFALLLWAWALREPAKEAARRPMLLDPATYRIVIPEMNRRLAKLNEDLATFWKVKAPRT